MRAHLPLLALTGLLLAVAVAGCDLFRAVQPSSAVLVRVDASGGLCPQGECANRWEIRRDGVVVSTGAVVPDIEPPVLARIIAAIDSADWAEVLARPFTGECPKNFDGQEYTYTFPTAAGDVVVASCTTQVDPGQEPFESILNALFAAGG
ncbi:MAG: hypothetical protein Q8M74_01230 [Chloroflexota bacterium]|nr:hypothetical protein [Chloroflexota bacterium]